MTLRTIAKRVIPEPMWAVVRRALSHPAPDSRGLVVSTAYKPLPADDVPRVARELGDAWKSTRMPAAQLALAERELTAFARGEPVPVFDMFVRLVKRIPGVDDKSLLEVGCSSGYYADLLRLCGLRTTYAGCDFAPAFVELARARLPEVDFRVEDATALGYAAASWDIVVSGCCLLHIIDYPAAIREAARVAREWVLFHRTPVIHLTPTRHYRKLAYEVSCLEIHFNETELISLFRAAGLALVDVETVSVGGPAPDGDVHVVKSYLCVKR
jgi:SAM-dependent methyltransferase